MTYKQAVTRFIIIVFLLFSSHLILNISLWWIMMPVLIFLTTLIYGSASIKSDFLIKAFCSSDTKTKQIAITFDDGPNAIYTPKVLSLLKEYKVKATFFVIGKNINGNENIIKQADAEGHTIGNHTFTHSFFIDFKTTNGFKLELNQTSDLVFNITGKRIKLFRPPYGVTTPPLAKAARALNYHIIGWNVRSFDTTKDNEDIIIKRVLKQIKPGAILLFHDTSEKTINVLRQTLTFAKQNGYEITGLEQLLNITIYE